MKISIEKLQDAPVVYDAQLSAKFLNDNCDAAIRLDKAQGQITYAMRAEEITARGTLSSALHTCCVRCLQEIEIALKVDVQLFYWPRTGLEESETLEVQIDDPDYVTYSGDYINPDEELREVLLSEAPMLPVCNESCLGLCPQCGTNRNLAECKCSPIIETDPGKGPINPSWAEQLKQIKLPKK